MGAPGLCTMFNLDDAATFLRDHWPNKALVARGPVERLAGLVDHDFDALVKMKKRFTLAFFRTLNGESVSLPIVEGQERSLYDAGMTIYFNSLRSESIDAWVGALDGELGLVRGATRVSGFASRRGLGLPTHYDHNDNFVCQAQGVKRWRLARNTHVRNPTVGYTLGEKPTPMQLAEAPDGFPSEMPASFDTVDLEPGTVMFMPRGTWHDTQTVEAESLHFNVQCGLATWKDVLEYVLLKTTALHAEPFRDPVERVFLRGRDIALGADLGKKLQAVCDAISEGELHLDRDALYRFIAQRRLA